MTLPGANFTLRSVNAPAARRPNGDPGAAGATLWEGTAPCYISRTDEDRTQTDREVMVRVTRLDAFVSEGAPVDEVASGDWDASIVTVEDLDGARTIYTVTGYERKGQGTVADKVSLILDNPKAGS